MIQLSRARVCGGAVAAPAAVPGWGGVRVLAWPSHRCSAVPLAMQRTALLWKTGRAATGTAATARRVCGVRLPAVGWVGRQGTVRHRGSFLGLENTIKNPCDSPERLGTRCAGRTAAVQAEAMLMLRLVPRAPGDY